MRGYFYGQHIYIANLAQYAVLNIHKFNDEVIIFYISYRSENLKI